jgi:hypothetical protein
MVIFTGDQSFKMSENIMRHVGVIVFPSSVVVVSFSIRKYVNAVLTGKRKQYKSSDQLLKLNANFRYNEKKT